MSKLVVMRRRGERIRIGPDVWVEIVEVYRDRCRVLIDAPREVVVLREELITEEPCEKKPA